MNEITDVMKTKTIKTEKGTLLVVELLEGAYYPNICQLPPSIGVNYFLYENGVNTPYKEPLDIPKGNWQLIGRMPEITEEQAENVVDKVIFEDEEFGDIIKYRDYLAKPIRNYNKCYAPITALESLYSLLQANEVYFENPLPEPKTTPYQDAKFDVDEVNDWYEAQSKVFDKNRTYLFIKLD